MKNKLGIIYFICVYISVLIIVIIKSTKLLFDIIVLSICFIITLLFIILYIIINTEVKLNET